MLIIRSAPFVALLGAILGLLPTVNSASAANPTDWSQPPVGCVEEIVPTLPSYPCLDLSQVKDPESDFPADFTPANIELWRIKRKKSLAYCRAREVVRREKAHPGSQNPVIAEGAWMKVLGAENSEAKIDAIYDASRETGVPEQVLTGALLQESVLADLGIAPDGGNYSCGIGQLNLLEWCAWAEHEGAQAGIDWPAAEVKAYHLAHPGARLCTEPLISPKLLEPFYRIAIARMGSRPSFMMTPDDLKDIHYADVVTDFPAASEGTQRLRYLVANSFANYCTTSAASIPAKANALQMIFATQIPSELTQVQRYPIGEGFHRTCRRASGTRDYPLHIGWLLADAVYNAGENAVHAMTHYRRLAPWSAADPKTWETFYPMDLVTALYWGGKYNPKSDLIDFDDLEGRPHSMIWFKSCVVQRHIARVVQRVTLDGYHLADSLEDTNGCKKSDFDGQGHLIRTSVPPARQVSSGQAPD